jgi:sugar O-acyltransferase (sialic acid O-acetyltransferase NeuD family)
VVAALGTGRLLSGPTPLLFVGGGGFAREAAEAVRAVNEAQRALTGAARWELRGILDEDPAQHGSVVAGVPIVGDLAALDRYTDAQVVVCTGHPGNFASKRKIVELLGLSPDRYATVVHPAAVVPPSCQIGPGSVLLAGTVVTADVRIGAHVAVMPQVVLTHDDEVGEYAILGAGVRLAGGVRVGTGAYVGSGALVRENRSVGASALVGMGAVVTRDIPPGEVWAGVPARFVRLVAAR